MEKFKGTPGPWNAQEHAVWGKEIGDQIALSAIKREKGIVTSEGLANAQLIASAPDMLKALELIFKNGDDYSGMVAKQAINKALGINQQNK